MTEQREVRPGMCWMVTRRMTRRHYLMRPDADGVSEQLYWYFTIVAANRTAVKLHCVQAPSNHLHEVVDDVEGRLPRFYELRNRWLAMALKEHREWDGEVFDKEGAHWLELGTPEAMLQELAYVITNCIHHGLTRTPGKWPGVKVLVDDIGRRVVRVERPDVWLDPDNPDWPPVAEMALEMPAMLVEAFGSEEAAREALRAKVDERAAEARAENKRAGRGYLGAKRVMKTPFDAQATSDSEREGGKP
ncbi:MAG TPA: transposase, partial [Sandaracinaceae bacterium LLY-WYZ-13_1]|nr:transposase [Sandaracinaceae bacterium LLY-WYZ-13_1]